MLSPKLLDRHPSQAVWTITYKSTCVRFLSFGFSQNVLPRIVLFFMVFFVTFSVFWVGKCFGIVLFLEPQESTICEMRLP